MIAAILDDNYERIQSDLQSLGLSYDPLTDDMLDHVCCMVEVEMEEGADFESSYRDVMGRIGDKRLAEIQHQTLLNLDKKFQRMKNFTYVFGLASALVTLVGTIFKRMHWPGAGILITIGIFMVVFVFLPLYFINSQKEQVEKKNPIYAIVGYLTMALLLLGATFKIMHWPGASIAIYLSIGFLLIGFMPLYVVNIFQKTGTEKARLPYLVMVLVGISIVMLFSNINMGRYLINTYLEESLANEQRVAEVEERTDALLLWANDSLNGEALDQAIEIHEKYVLLQARLDELQESLIAYVGPEGASIEDVNSLDNKMAGRMAMIDNGRGRLFMEETLEFRELIFEVVKDPVALNQIEDHMEFTGEIWDAEHGPRGVRDAPLVKNYYKNTDASKGLALAEYVAIVTLLHSPS